MSGCLYIVGMGPGDPELMTRKAERILRKTSVIAYFAKKNEFGHARHIADELISKNHHELRFDYPMTTEISHHTTDYKKALHHCYDDAAQTITSYLDKGQDVALLCEGDPLLYGSAMYILERLHPHYSTHIIPGISAMSGCWSAAHLPIVRYEQTLTILPATLPLETLVDKLTACDAVVIMKIGRNFDKVKTALTQTQLLHRALYIERGTQAAERILPLAQVADKQAPYFSLILIAGESVSS